MTELVNGMGQSQELNSNPVATSSMALDAIPEEKVLKQSEVNEIVGRAKHEAVERYKRSLDSQSTGINTQSTPGISRDEVERMTQDAAQRFMTKQMDDAQRKAQEQDAQRIVNEFAAKLATGKEKFQDFEQITSDIDIGRFPRVVQLLAGYVDNVPDVMYELGKDRIKMANLEQLASMSPRDAVVQVQRLSKALKDNEQAGKVKLPNEPLSQMRPSNTGTDTGALSVSDYRKRYKG